MLHDQLTQNLTDTTLRNRKIFYTSHNVVTSNSHIKPENVALLHNQDSSSSSSSPIPSTSTLKQSGTDDLTTPEPSLASQSSLNSEASNDLEDLQAAKPLLKATNYCSNCCSREKMYIELTGRLLTSKVFSLTLLTVIFLNVALIALQANKYKIIIQSSLRYRSIGFKFNEWLSIIDVIFLSVALQAVFALLKHF